MKTIYAFDKKLNLDKIFTNEEINSLKKTFPSIKILTMENNVNINKQNSSKSKLNHEENLKVKAFVYKKSFYKFILENAKKKYEQEGNNYIMVKSLSCIIDDLFYEDKNLKLINSKKLLIHNNIDKNKKNEKNNFNKIKQMFNISLTEKKININNNDITDANINKEISNKINKDEKIILRNKIENIKKIKLTNNNYKNIYFNFKKIIDNDNNNLNKDSNKSRKNLINKKFIMNNKKPLYYMDYSINYQNNLNNINPSNLAYINHKRAQSNNYNKSNYFSTIQFNRTDKNKNSKVTLNKNLINQTMADDIFENYNYNNSNFLHNGKKKGKNYKKLSKKIKREFLTKYNSNNKNRTPIQIRKMNICTEKNIENIFNIKRHIYMNVDTNLFNNIENQDFNIFNLNKNVGRENILPVIGYYIFNRLGFYNILKYDKFENWCKKLAEGYIKSNPYHTDLHAADITHTCLIYLKVGKVNKICKLSKNSKCSLFLSCICHDYKHPGVNNNFLKETRNKIAIKYNDISILENMHIAETFKLINNQNNEFNIFQDLDNETYKQFRKEMISCVLATDMTFHKEYEEFLKKYSKENENTSSNTNNTNDDKKNSNEYQNYMNILIHSSDISNPTKPFDIDFQWAELVVEEF